jgi:hypothetical protein
MVIHKCGALPGFELRDLACTTVRDVGVAGSNPVTPTIDFSVTGRS